MVELCPTQRFWQDQHKHDTACMHWFPWKHRCDSSSWLGAPLFSLALTDQSSVALWSFTLSRARSPPGLNQSQHQPHWLAGLFDATPRVWRVFLWERHLIWRVVIPLQIWWRRNNGLGLRFVIVNLETITAQTRWIKLLQAKMCAIDPLLDL